MIFGSGKNQERLSKALNGKGGIRGEGAAAEAGREALAKAIEAPSERKPGIVRREYNNPNMATSFLESLSEIGPQNRLGLNRVIIELRGNPNTAEKDADAVVQQAVLRSLQK